jgi:acyl-CoA hydrolase
MKKDSITFRFLTEPGDVNFGGKVHGGTVMKWIDQAGYTCAVNWCDCYCVTVYVGGIRFVKPIFIGDIAEVYARIIYTGRTSMHIAVDIKAINPKTKLETKTTHCIIVFAAVDDAGKTVEVPNWMPQTEEDFMMQRYAQKLMEMRKQISAEMENFFFE